jgi:thiol reductant ABC exporter CydC subunit
MTRDWRRWRSFLRLEWRGFGVATVLQFATVASGIGLMATSAWLISTAALRPSIAALGVAIVGVRFFGLSRGLFRYLDRLATHRATLSLLARLRVAVFEALPPLAPFRLRAYRSGDLVSRLVDDIESLDNVFARVIGPSAAAVLVAWLVSAVLVPRGTGLALAAVLGMAIAGVIMPVIAIRTGANSAARTVALRADLAARAADAVQGLDDLVAFNRSAAFRDDLSRRSLELAAAQGRSVRVSAAAAAAAVLAGDFTAMAVLLLAVADVQAGALAGVQLAVVVLTAMAAFEAAGPLAAAWQNLGATRAAANRLSAIFDAPPAVALPAAPLPPPRGRTLRVRGLSYRYPDSATDAAAGVSFVLAPGRCVAVVGSSGAGKSTVASLLLRFLEAPAGAITLDGHDVRGYAADDVRACMTYADQRASILTGTIRENLAIADPTASEARMAEALAAVGLSGLVERLPDRLDAWIGEQGHALSGGERQRLGLARAMLKPSPFVVLDEPTAHLDPVSEQNMLGAIRRLSATRGVLLITHRVIGLDFASDIIVLSGGRVIQQGSFADLQGRDGWFRRMLAIQRAAAVVEEAGGPSSASR